MANSIDLIVGKEAILGLENLISKLTIADDLILKTSQSALALSKSTSTISSTGGLTNNTAQNASQNADMQKYIKTVEALEKKIINLTAAKKANQQASLQDKVDARISLQNATAEAKAVSTKIDAYTRLDLAHKKAMQSAKNIGTTYGSTSQEFKVAAERANKLDHELKAIDETLGKNNRNVGNYKSGWNGLGNSINQLTREMPAFAVSANTGFLALSNNIPMLFDQINQLKAANIELAKSGEPTKSVFKSVAAAFFSWQTALSVGVTVLTLYGGKIWDMAFGLTAAEKAQKLMNEEIKKTQVATTAEIVQLDALTKIVKDHNVSNKDRQIAYNEIKETLPGLTAKTYEQAIATGELTRVTDLYTQSIIAKNVVEIKAKSIAERQTELDLESAKSYEEKRGKVEMYLQSLQPKEQQLKIKKAMSDQDKAEIKIKQDLIDKDVKALSLDIVKANSLESQTEKYTKATKAKADKIKADKIEIEGVKSLLVVVGTLNDELDKEISRLTTEKIVANADELPAVVFQLEQLYKVKKQLNQLPTAGALPDNFVKPEDVENLKELTQEMKNYLRSFVDEFAGNSGFEGVLHLFDGEDSLFSRMQEGMAFTKDSWKSDTIQMMEGVQEMYNFITDASQANFDKEYARLDEQKKTALKFAGDSATAKEKIEADYEKKKKQIAEREFKAKQKQAIVNVAIDTAQAIMSLWVKPGFPAAIPMAVAVGALGALQMGVIASQKIPQYFEGGTHKGGMMLVNDAKGSNYQETIVTPDGKIMQPTERNVLMDAPSGTQIFTPEQWHEKQLFEMMQGKGIAMTNNYAKSNGLTYEQMDAVIGKHFANITTQTNVFDRNGFSSYSSKQGNITIRNNNRSQGIGFSV